MFKTSNSCSRMLKMYSKRSRFQKFSGGGGMWQDQPRNLCEIFPDNPWQYIHSKQKLTHTFLLAHRHWGTFRKEEPLRLSNKKFHNDNVKSVQSYCADWTILCGLSYCLRITDKSNVNTSTVNLWQNTQYLWNIFFSRRSVRVLLELIGRWTQQFSKINQEKCKIEQICIWNARNVPDF